MIARLALVLAACLALAACADRDGSANDNRFSGFYAGGTAGGGASR